MPQPSSNAYSPSFQPALLGLECADEVAELFKSVRFELALRGLDLWQHGYPNLQQIEKDLAAKTLWGWREGEKLVAVVTLNFESASQYERVSWGIQARKPLIIHRLATLASYQGTGLGSQMLVFCELQANALGCDAIRLDTYVVNRRNMAFYHKRGYREMLEHVYFLPQAHPFVCFEKAVATEI